MRIRWTAAFLPLAAAFAVAAPAHAGYSDLEITDVEAFPKQVEVGVPTVVKYVVHVRDNGEAIDAQENVVRADGQSSTNKPHKYEGQPPDFCDPPSSPFPGCHMSMLSHEFRISDHYERVTATAPGQIYRQFRVFVYGKSFDPRQDNDVLGVNIAALPVNRPQISARVVSRSALKRSIRARAACAIRIRTSQRGQALVNVYRIGKGGKLKFHGAIERDLEAGLSTIRVHQPLYERFFNRGKYRFDVQLTNEDGVKSAKKRLTYRFKSRPKSDLDL